MIVFLLGLMAGLTLGIVLMAILRVGAREQETADRLLSGALAEKLD